MINKVTILKFLFLINIYFLFTLYSANAQEALTFKKDTIQLGKKVKGEKDIDFLFIFSNTSNAPLTIEKIGVSCRCTEVSWSMKSIPILGTGEIRGTYSLPSSIGKFKTRIVVFSNSNNETIKTPIYIEGEVIQANNIPSP